MAPKKNNQRQARLPVSRMPTYKFQLKQVVLESTIPWATVGWIDLKQDSAYHDFARRFSAYKVISAGIQVPPGSYVEAIIRETVDQKLNTRAELVTQQDVKIFGPLRRSPAVFMRKPGTAIPRNWVDMFPNVSTVIDSGLSVCICGQNDQTAGSVGIVCQIILNVLFKGPQTGQIVRANEGAQLHVFEEETTIL